MSQTNQEMQIVMSDPTRLRIHKLRRHLPQPNIEMPDYVALNNSVRASGILQPLLITESGDIADGVWRWQAAKEYQFKAVPCVVIEEDMVPVVVAESLAARKQMTRGAVVYLMIPVMKDIVFGFELRRNSNLKKGNQAGEIELNPNVSPKDSNWPSETLAEVAKRLGVGPSALKQARSVWQWLNEPELTALRKLHTDFELAVPAAAELKQLQEDLRADFEPQLLNGEKNLWNVESGIKGRLKGGAHEPTHQQLHLFGDALDSLAVRAERFDSPNKAAAEVKEWLVNLEKNMSGVGKTTEEYREKITRIADATKVAHDAIVARLRELEREAKAK